MSGSSFQPPINLDPHQDPSQQTAFINQNFQSLASSLNPFIVSDGTNNRIILGKQGDGTYGMKVSKVGVDVGTATNSQLIFNSNQDILKIVSTGTIGLTTTLGADSEVTVTHNLGFVPIVLAFLELSSTEWVPLPYDSNIVSGHFVVTLEDIRISHITTTQVQFISQTSPDASVNTYTIKYYLLQETASS